MRFADLRAHQHTVTENGALDDNADDSLSYLQYACLASSVGTPGLLEIGDGATDDFAFSI